ncbi:unnamed protein product [Nesidiocoris tenuis]|uniref:C2H2-type domain-containing protein n=1 Tax=Nesidiocoris tenuis TaxID=355587 RepID=A0A6H5GUW0_9HEMI|nr:unnamed protein product [Nesidiocoris tenuis]
MISWKAKIEEKSLYKIIQGSDLCIHRQLIKESGLHANHLVIQGSDLDSPDQRPIILGMMEHTVSEHCEATGPISIHAMDCEDEDLEDCQTLHYAKRFDDYSELSNLVKKYHALLASEKKQTAAPSAELPRTTSQPVANSPGIKPVDINSLLQPAEPLPKTFVLSPSAVTSTPPTGRVWLDRSQVQIVNGNPVRFQFVPSSSQVSSLVPSQIRVAPQTPAPSPVRIVAPASTPLHIPPAISSIVSPSYADLLTPQMNSQPQSAGVIVKRTTIVANDQPPTPSRAIHNLPQQPIMPVRVPPLRPAMEPRSTITTPSATYFAKKPSHPIRSSPHTQPSSVSNSAAQTERPLAPASPVSQLQTLLLNSPEERPVLTKPLITYGRASPTAPLTVQPSVPPPPLVNTPPPTTPSVPGKSLPLLPCTIPERNQERRNSDKTCEPARPSDLVDLTEDGSALKPDKPDKVATGKGVDTKMFPSLVVVARPSLNKFSSMVVNAERQAFDAEIRKMLACPVRHFIKRLFQLGLLQSNQQCNHGTTMTFREPPLWVSRCCPDKSVFANSVFNGSSLSPVKVIKLFYHWACNSNVVNVIDWVKVFKVDVRTHYTNFRAVCTTVVQQNIGLLGGEGRSVQIGVISLGTTTTDNGPKEVKLDILAAFDQETKRVRLKALDNSEIQKDWDEPTVYKYKFRRIAENLAMWVDPISVIVLDFSVDYEIFSENGFHNIVMSGTEPNCTNDAIMSYLRRSIPQMFQDTLSLLSINIIQQFLDELVWREIWGPTPSLAYENLIAHIAEIMKLGGPPIMEKLKLIAQNPSADWKYSVWQKEQFSTTKNVAGPKSAMGNRPFGPASNKKSGSKSNRRKSRAATSRSQQDADDQYLLTPFALPKPATPPKLAVTVPPSSSNEPSAVVTSGTNSKAARQISLELYYYGFIKGNSSSDQEQKSFSILCVFCSALISSSTDLTEHLIAHALDPAFSWYMIPYMKKICWHCSDAVTDIRSHVAEKHPPPRNTPTSCKICAIDFKESAPLVEHMTQTHTELDMPYQCQICNFRTSFFEEITSHFRSSHDADPSAVCPYCLKAVIFTSSPYLDSRQSGLQNYFVQHVQKHRIESLNRKCEKCALSFVNHDSLKSHQDRHHVSCKGMPNLTRYKILPSKVVMMDRPTEPPLPPVTSTESSFHTLQGKTLPLPQFRIDSETLALNCLECDGPISESHYTLKLKCTKCSFTSHCANAIREHSTRAHTADGEATQRTGGIPTLSSFMFCSNCDFHSNDGNKTAEHLAACGSHATVAQKRNLTPKTSAKRRR